MTGTIMRLLAAVALLASLTACTEPQFGAQLGFGAGGMSLSPSLSGRIGGARLSISG